MYIFTDQENESFLASQNIQNFHENLGKDHINLSMCILVCISLLNKRAVKIYLYLVFTSKVLILVCIQLASLMHDINGNDSLNPRLLLL